MSIGEHKSQWTSMTYGVPQGSILAPLLFRLYMLPLSQIMRKNRIESELCWWHPDLPSLISKWLQPHWLWAKSEHLTPVLRSLHWLSVTFRIDFKALLLVYKSLNGLGPKYIADMLTEYKPNRPLRSLASSQLETPRVHTKQEESAFRYYAARSWNQLPKEIRGRMYKAAQSQIWILSVSKF